MESRPLDYAGRTTTTQFRPAFTQPRWLVALAPFAVFGALVFGVACFITAPPERDDGEARTSAAKAALHALTNAVRLFQIDTGRIPADSEGLGSLRVSPSDVQPNWRGPYIDSGNGPRSADPWGNHYRYRRITRNGTTGFQLSSAGRGGQFGTADDILIAVP